MSEIIYVTEITPESFGIFAKEINKRIKHIDSLAEPNYERDKINIIINSYGGDLGTSFAFYDYINNIKWVEFISIGVYGSCMSAAIPLLLSIPQHNRYAGTNSMFMIHPTNVGNELKNKTHFDVKDYMQYAEITDARYDIIISNNTKLNDGVCSLNYPGSARSTQYFSAQDALDMGFIGYIV